MVPIATLLTCRRCRTTPRSRRAASHPSRGGVSCCGAGGRSRGCLPGALGSTGHRTSPSPRCCSPPPSSRLRRPAELAAVASGGVAAGLVAVVPLLNLAPSFLYWASHGQNDAAIPRGISETEVTVSASRVALPRVDHRIDALADASGRATGTAPWRHRSGATAGAHRRHRVLGLVVLTLSRVLRPRGDENPSRAFSPLGNRARSGSAWAC